LEDISYNLAPPYFFCFYFSMFIIIADSNSFESAFQPSLRDKSWKASISDIIIRP